MINEKYRLIMLYDFYGKLLTENQKEVLDMYCNFDMSLGEIASNLENTRQAVYDSVKRSEKKMEQFDEKLMLIERFDKISDLAMNLKDVVAEIDNDNLDNKINELKQVTEEILKIY